ncbi:MAG: hypothetical protein ACR2IK_25460 [Chloroflexota bacterium]
MSQLWLLARARRVLPVVCFIAVIEVLVAIYGSVQFRVGQHTVQPVPVAVVAPVLIACAVATIYFSPQPIIDRSSTRDLRPLVLALVVAVMSAATAGLVTATQNLDGELTTWAACRDLVGFSGLAFIGAALFSAAWYWTLPVLAAIVPLTGLSGHGLVELVTWALRPDDSKPAVVIACVWLGLGLFISQASEDLSILTSKLGVKLGGDRDRACKS